MTSMYHTAVVHSFGFPATDSTSTSALDAQLGEYASLVLGDTDSERYFALITQQTDAHGGDVSAGIVAAARWIAANLPVTALNAVIAAPGELWALRYPDQHALHIIERPAGPGQHPAGPRGIPGHRGLGAIGGRGVPGGQSPRPAECPPESALTGLHLRNAMSSFHMPALASAPSVVVASERLDGESAWRMLAPGELVHVRPDLSVESALVITDPPARLVPLGKPDPGIDT